MKEEINDKIKSIKQSFRLFMDGAVAKSMRDKGLQYHLNWGIPTTRLKEMATPYGKDYNLAVALWKENIRECKILATLIMPPKEMPIELVELWMEETPSQELAEITAFNLYQYLSFAPVLAYRWIASSNDIEQICGYQLLARLFMKGQEPNERGVNEFIDQACTALQSSNSGLQRAAYNCIIRFSNLSDEYKKISEQALKSLDLQL